MALGKEQLLQQKMQNKQVQAQKELASTTLKSQITQTHLNKRYYPYTVSSTGVFHENKAEERVPLNEALEEVQQIVDFIQGNNRATKAIEEEGKVDMKEIKKLTTA